MDIKVKSNVLKDILTGRAIPCGSGMYQDSSGSMFLGAVPDSALKEIKSIIRQVEAGKLEHDQTIDDLIDVFNYSTAA